MKVVVINNLLKEKHFKLLRETAEQTGADLCFAASEAEIPEAYRDAEVLYGFGVNTARTSQNLKWLSVPSAGVDFLMQPGNRFCAWLTGSKDIDNTIGNRDRYSPGRLKYRPFGAFLIIFEIGIDRQVY